MKNKRNQEPISRKAETFGTPPHSQMNIPHNGWKQQQKKNWKRNHALLLHHHQGAVASVKKKNLLWSLLKWQNKLKVDSPNWFTCPTDVIRDGSCSSDKAWFFQDEIYLELLRLLDPFLLRRWITFTRNMSIPYDTFKAKTVHKTPTYQSHLSAKDAEGKRP